MPIDLRLEPVTAANVREVCALRVRVEQDPFVTANAVSLAEAQFYAAAWFRAAYVGDDLVGFVMLHDSLDGPGYMIWRLMIDARFQGRGYGREVVQHVSEYVRARPHGQSVKVGAHRGPGGPAGFYESLGFRPTGEIIDPDEVVYELNL